MGGQWSIRHAGEDECDRCRLRGETFCPHHSPDGVSAIRAATQIIQSISYVEKLGEDYGDRPAVVGARFRVAICQ